jgi:glycosyltransferase involved in cell wall biosynthesis
MNKVAIIGTNGLPGRYGGWDQLLNHLTLNLKEKCSFIVYTSSYNAVKGLKEYNGAKLQIIRLKANGLQSVFYDALSLFHSALKYDILVVLGTSGCIFLPFIRLFKKRIILNPDGQEWKRGKWSKPVKLFLAVSERIGIKYADIVVADNKKIQEYIMETYKLESILIEYGGDNASFVPLSPSISVKYSIEANKYAFKVCRIEPENNIDIILEAFKESEMNLVLVGNWNYSKYGRNLRLKYSNYSNLRLLDPIYDQKSLDELRSNCGLYIHGHSVGGTNPSLVEAMNLGLCCVVFDVEYNKETTENSAIFFKSSDDLKNILTDFLNNKIDVLSCKSKMREIAQRRYRWDVIIGKYETLLIK